MKKLTNVRGVAAVKEAVVATLGAGAAALALSVVTALPAGAAYPTIPLTPPPIPGTTTIEQVLSNAAGGVTIPPVAVAGGTLSLSAPNGTLDAGAAVQIGTPDAASLAQIAAANSLPANAIIASFSIQWGGTQVTQGGHALSGTFASPNIHAGDVLYVLTANGLQRVGVAAADGAVSFSLTSDPVFVVLPPSVTPRAATGGTGTSATPATPATPSSGGALAFTGLNRSSQVAAESGVGLILAGGGLVIVTRRRRQKV